MASGHSTPQTEDNYHVRNQTVSQTFIESQDKKRNKILTPICVFTILLLSIKTNFCSLGNTTYTHTHTHTIPNVDIVH